MLLYVIKYKKNPTIDLSHMKGCNEKRFCIATAYIVSRDIRMKF